MKENDSGTVVYFPLVRGFTDTGFVKHEFGSGSVISARVVPSDDITEGANIELYIKDSNGKVACRTVLDKFSALCLVDAIVKNLVNQEEILHDTIRRLQSRSECKQSN